MREVLYLKYGKKQEKTHFQKCLFHLGASQLTIYGFNKMVKST